MYENLERVSWRCRRGLLELDLVLSSFMKSRYQALSHDHKKIFTELLEYSDNELWDLITQRSPWKCSLQAAVLRQLAVAIDESEL